jgi:hypothetical protein
MTWLRCSACRKDLDFGVMHWVCSVSTCNRNNTNYKFCSVACWDSHVATLRHRDSWAVEERAPSRQAYQQEPSRPAASDLNATRDLHAPAPRPITTSGPEPIRRMIAAPTAPTPPAGAITLAEADAEILIVVSKLKKYIRDRSGMNTSDSVAEGLSDHVRAICDDAIRTAATDGRKTVLDRDVPKLRR